MGNLDGHGGLAAVQIAFFSLSLLVAIHMLRRYGVSRQHGWFYIIILSLLRIVGSSCLIYQEINNDHSTGLEATIFITTAIGTAPLLLALAGLLERVNFGMNERRQGYPHAQTFYPLHIVTAIFLILAIVGGLKMSTANSLSDPKLRTGQHLMQAGSIGFLVVYFWVVLLTGMVFKRKQYFPQGEINLIYVVFVALPFLLIRVIYSVTLAFSTSPTSDFFFFDVTIWAEAFMRFLMEAIVVILYIVAGFLIPAKSVRTTAQRPKLRHPETGHARSS